MNYSKIKKINPNDDLVIVEFTTAKGKGRGKGTTTTKITYPKVIADQIEEKG